MGRPTFELQVGAYQEGAKEFGIDLRFRCSKPLAVAPSEPAGHGTLPDAPHFRCHPRVRVSATSSQRRCSRRTDIWQALPPTMPPMLILEFAEEASATVVLVALSINIDIVDLGS